MGYWARETGATLGGTRMKTSTSATIVFAVRRHTVQPSFSQAPSGFVMDSSERDHNKFGRSSPDP
jgi:hypothetical protein